MTSTVKKTDRISARVNDHVRNKINEAAELSGSTLNQFLVAAAMKEAERVIEKERIVRLDAKNSRNFLKVLVKPPAPAKQLVQFFRDHA